MWNVIFNALIATGVLTILGRRIGRTFFEEESRGIATLVGTLCSIALFSLVGTVMFYVASINIFTLSIGAALVIIGTMIVTPKTKQRVSTKPISESPMLSQRSILPLLTIGAISLWAWWSAVLAMPITDAVRSPWLVLSPVSIIAPATALIISFVLIKVHKPIGSFLLFSTLFSLFASASFLFPLGYGFDPFLHRATVLHIAEFGTVTPKPLYYIGEYAIELFTHFFTGISIFTIDTFLIPILAALACVVASRRLPAGIAILLIAMSNFVVSTPQSLGYIFVLLSIVTTAKHISSKKDLVVPSIFAIAAFAAHPIAGVPAIMFVLFNAVRNRAPRIILAILSAIALPAMFILQAILSNAAISITWTNLWRLDLLPLSSFLFTNGSPWLDALYLVIGNLSLIALVFAVIGAIVRRSSMDSVERSGGIISITLIISFILISLGLDFTYLISYERQDFALRLITLATLFALPLASAGIETIWKQVSLHRLHVPALLIYFLFAAASIYNLYPRHDGYARSSAFNVSQYDIEAVNAIHEMESENSDYIVLSNQATAAAALQEFGFRKYYHGDIFYYPIPTGGVLYQYYLSLVDGAPMKETMKEAMNTAGVHKAYFVVSDYWWNKDAIIETAKQQTDDWLAVHEGKVTVFVFTDEESAP
ncbi:MAG: hypothetical protein WCT28_03075 [Patescibacteria group bacterium]|jgi:hypothetical protein